MIISVVSIFTVYLHGTRQCWVAVVNESADLLTQRFRETNLHIKGRPYFMGKSQNFSPDCSFPGNVGVLRDRTDSCHNRLLETSLMELSPS
jgi:hypothetical protein